jgi:hypothetical protein
MDDVKTPNVVDLSTLGRSQRYELAKSIIKWILAEWLEAKDEEEWREKNVEYYGASMSFDELVAERAAVSFNNEGT